MVDTLQHFPVFFKPGEQWLLQPPAAPPIPKLHYSKICYRLNKVLSRIYVTIIGRHLANIGKTPEFCFEGNISNSNFQLLQHGDRSYVEVKKKGKVVPVLN
jgi:hypothetical protein